MPLAKKVGDLEFCSPGALFREGFSTDETQTDAIGGIAAGQPAHHGGERDVSVFILIGAEDCSLRCHHPNHRETLVTDPQALSDGTAAGKELVTQIRANHNNSACGFDVLFCDETSSGDLETSYGKKFRCDPEDRRGAASRSSLNDFIGIDLWCHPLHTRDLLCNRFSIFKDERLRKCHTLPAGVVAARHNEEHIGAKGAELALRKILSATTHSDEGDHGRIADHDPKHGEQASQAIGSQCGESHPDGFGDGQVARHSSGGV